jgi:DNA-binding GntR family transcriptional regulator
MVKNALRAIAPQSLVETIVSRLEAAMMEGTLAPGERLSEMALAKSLGVSRGPLREAIRQLEGRKLIERTPNVGARVASFTRERLDEILTIREALEGMACRLAAEEMTEDELAVVEQLLLEDGAREQVRQGLSYFHESDDFDLHCQIIRGSHNERLIGMLCDDLYDLLRVYRGKMSTISGRAKLAYVEHEKVVIALKVRDAAGAEAAMREHIHNSRLHAIQNFEPNLAPVEQLDQLLGTG